MRYNFLITWLFMVLVGFGLSSSLLAQKQVKKSGAQTGNSPKNYRSKNFLIHTDLPKKEAKKLLKRLEKMLKIISKYWGVRNRKTIECYVVKDINNWAKGTLDPRGEKHIRAGGGVTMTRTAFQQGRVVAAKAIVYAIAQRGVPLHEAVHAYCGQNFGRTGPVWYSEGMAEMGQYWRKMPQKGKPIQVNCENYVINYIKRSPPKSLREIVSPDEKTGDSWKSYSWRWALCHLLATNPNYSSRFRKLGLGLLTNKNVSFKRTYGAMADKISFEYKFFLQHLDKGYRVDLCSWDWKTKFQKLKGKRFSKNTIKANKGWQPSRLVIESGKEYQLTTDGTWKTKKGGTELTADGSKEEKGKLLGVIFKNYELSQPFELGKEKTFVAPSDGKLFLRCEDKWNELADNEGKITVTIQLK
ncbi:hypothetical protein MNBD_PLANCTO02-1966 [hydrothermal vent metagenome]|uniref:Uncharacterized protein n=1 Tax=hydrothermal vent metagenome TaxID=652676 RepID=A0A3B1E3K0_9ZZZZ